MFDVTDPSGLVVRFVQSINHCDSHVFEQERNGLVFCVVVSNVASVAVRSLVQCLTDFSHILHGATVTLQPVDYTYGSAC